MILNLNQSINNFQNADGEEVVDENRILKPSHKQHLAANSKVVLTADIGTYLVTGLSCLTDTSTVGSLV